MPLHTPRLLILAVCLATLPALAAGPEKVQLRWKLPPGAPLGYELLTQSVTPGRESMRLDLSQLKQSGVAARKRQELFEVRLPTESAMAVVLTPRGSDELAAKVVVTRIAMPAKKARASKQEREMAKRMKAMEGTVQLRAAMTGRGFVTSDLKREQRNLLAVMFELPANPVAVGDTWTHSADLLKMGSSFNGEHDTFNRVELVSLNKEAGGTVAVIDFTLAERHDGRFSDPRSSKVLPAMMEMTWVARGEFLVETGRWRRVAGRMTTRATGMMETDTEQQMVLVPLDPIPAPVLAAE